MEDEFEKTVSIYSRKKDVYITIKEKGTEKKINLSKFNTEKITFGRRQTNDIVLESNLVSGAHGSFILNDVLKIEDNDSTNGIFVNGNLKKECILKNKDEIKIDNPDSSLNEGVIITIFIPEEESKKEEIKKEESKEMSKENKSVNVEKIKEKVKELSKNKKYVTGVVVLLVVIALLIVFNISTPKRTVNSFFKAIENGDEDKVADLIYVNEKAIEEEFGEDEIDEYDLDELAENLVEMLEGEDLDYEITSVKKHSKTATVKIDVDGEEGKFYLKKVDGKWKIDIYKTFYEAYINQTNTIKSKYDYDDDYDY